ncbi:MAG: hypothetical protein ACM3Q2_18365, partial [Syntrophothermus sp.]
MANNIDKKTAKKPLIENKRTRILVTVSLSAFIIFLLLGAYVIKGLPSLEQLENPKPILASKIYGSDG